MKINKNLASVIVICSFSSFSNQSAATLLDFEGLTTGVTEFTQYGGLEWSGVAAAITTNDFTFFSGTHVSGSAVAHVTNGDILSVSIATGTFDFNSSFFTLGSIFENDSENIQVRGYANKTDITPLYDQTITINNNGWKFTPPASPSPQFHSFNFFGIERLEIEIPHNNNTSFAIDDFTFNEVAAVPVPAAAWLFGSGLMGLFGLARSRKA